MVEQFMRSRGLQLSPEKTCVTHIEQGFDFLGQNLRKYGGKLLIQPSKKNTHTFLEKMRQLIRQSRGISQTDLILTMPERYARVANQQFDNQLLALPLEMPAWDVYLYWHANVEDDPANKWLRERLTAAMVG